VDIIGEGNEQFKKYESGRKERIEETTKIGNKIRKEDRREEENSTNG
jgi:hypothetical protein